MNKVCVFLVAVFALPLHVAAAQTSVSITLRDLQTEAFPFITGYFTARDSNGASIENVQAEELQVLEDGAPRLVQQLREVDAQLHIIVALDPAESFNIRNAEALTRFDLVKESLKAWAGNLPSTSSTLLTLITPDGVLARDVLASEWSAALDSYVLPPGAPAGTQSFAQAVELASDPASEPGTNLAIWWLTATPPQSELPTLTDLQESLRQQAVPVFVWQVDAPSTLASEAGQALNTFSLASGGQFFTFSGVESLPQPETYFSPLRHIYFFQYSSQLRAAGFHDIAVQLDRPDISAVSEPVTINLDIQPPAPILVSPPSQIERAPSVQDPQSLSPFSQPIEIAVEFPDGFERNLVRSTLYVNDEPAAVNSTAPFNHFAWDLSNFTESQQVFLRVEVQDELGLVGTSIQFPVDVSVQPAPGWFQGLLARGGTTLAFSVLLISAGAFFLVMVLSGRIDLSRIRERFLGSSPGATPLPADPLRDAPEGIENGQADAPFQAGNKQNQPAIEAPAYLQRLTVQDPNRPAQVKPIEGNELLIGSAESCSFVLTEVSVDPQHSRIIQAENGEYHLLDLGSHAGTWLNYAPVSPGGSRLRDGDIIHIGKVPFRFFVTEASS